MHVVEVHAEEIASRVRDGRLRAIPGEGRLALVSSPAGGGRPRVRHLRLIAPTTQRPWSATEDEQVRRGYARGLGCNAIRATLLPTRTAGEIAARAARFGLGAHGLRWTDEADRRLASLSASGCSLQEAAGSLQRTPDAVRRRTKQLGIPCPVPERHAARSHRHWSRREDDVLRRSASRSLVALSQELGRSEEAVRQRLTALGRNEQVRVLD